MKKENAGMLAVASAVAIAIALIAFDLLSGTETGYPAEVLYRRYTPDESYTSYDATYDASGNFTGVEPNYHSVPEHWDFQVSSSRGIEVVNVSRYEYESTPINHVGVLVVTEGKSGVVYGRRFERGAER